MIRTCPACGQKNRIPAKHLAHRGKCGSCKAAIEPVGAPLDVGPEQFAEIIQDSSVPVLVDFWAEWCGPCRMAAPQVKRVAQDLSGRALVLKVDTEAHPDLAGRFGVRGIPNFAVIKNGAVVRQQAGLVDARVMQNWLVEAGA